MASDSDILDGGGRKKMSILYSVSIWGFTLWELLLILVGAFAMAYVCSLVSPFCENSWFGFGCHTHQAMIDGEILWTC